MDTDFKLKDSFRDLSNDITHYQTERLMNQTLPNESPSQSKRLISLDQRELNGNSYRVIG
jgi:hypothetical protein